MFNIKKINNYKIYFKIEPCNPDYVYFISVYKYICICI